MNVSRLYTVLARDVGFNHTLHVGRVITPTVALVCQRDREIAGFTPSPCWTLVRERVRTEWTVCRPMDTRRVQ
ncbi:DNA topoisomerase [Klebsiella pneumoniae]|uniref:DNA topoisomerase n=1 Tax=Klebsiella pneumoniae TaxID=573 RepID=UPI00294A464F|nr:DNA topoisomerase [Klebsiella pneumoniae]MDV5727865.1 DNA topoisomerase [Klebsiella pneumoniae]